jgi:hypothetical protein
LPRAQRTHQKDDAVHVKLYIGLLVELLPVGSGEALFTLGQWDLRFVKLQVGDYII